MRKHGYISKIDAMVMLNTIRTRYFTAENPHDAGYYLGQLQLIGDWFFSNPDFFLSDEFIKAHGRCEEVGA